MSNDTAARPALDLTIRAQFAGWPVDVHLSLPAEKVGAALARLGELGYTPRQEAPAPVTPRNEGPPTCPVHGTAKVKPSNHGGHFCAAKLADGSYCNEKPC